MRLMCTGENGLEDADSTFSALQLSPDSSFSEKTNFSKGATALRDAEPKEREKGREGKPPVLRSPGSMVLGYRILWKKRKFLMPPRSCAARVTESRDKSTMGNLLPRGVSIAC